MDGGKRVVHGDVPLISGPVPLVRRFLFLRVLGGCPNSAAIAPSQGCSLGTGRGLGTG